MKQRAEGVKAPPRLAITVTQQQWDTFRKFLPYGFQRQVFQAMIEDMCRMWEEFGDDFTRAMLAKNVTYKQFMRDYLDAPARVSENLKLLPEDDMGGTVTVYQGDQSVEEDQEGT